MPVDLRAALRSALDVAVPPLAIERVRERASRQLRSLERRRSRRLVAAAALVAVFALFAGGYGTETPWPATIAALPAPAPSPHAT